VTKHDDESPIIVLYDWLRSALPEHVNNLSIYPTQVTGSTPSPTTLPGHRLHTPIPAYTTLAQQPLNTGHADIDMVSQLTRGDPLPAVREKTPYVRFTPIDYGLSRYGEPARNECYAPRRAPQHRYCLTVPPPWPGQTSWYALVDKPVCGEDIGIEVLLDGGSL
jgi:hypothetical protein